MLVCIGMITKKNKTKDFKFDRATLYSNIERKLWKIQRKKFVFGNLNFKPNISFVWTLKYWAAFLRSRRIFWHPYWYIYIYACLILYVIYDIHVIFIVIYDIWHNLYDRYIYVNMVVKRSVWASGMQPSTLKFEQKKC